MENRVERERRQTQRNQTRYPGMERKKNRCRKDETVINRLKTGHTLLNHGYLLDGLPVPECELCHSHAMNVKHFITDCANLTSVRLRFFDGSNPKALKQIL